jgi:glycogen debranching enzyme
MAITQPRTKDIIEVDSQFYILAASSLADADHLILKDGDTFALCDTFGDIKPVGLLGEGLYHDGTRYLSSWLLRFDQERPLVLSASIKEDNARMIADLSNPDVVEDGKVVVPRGTLHLSRTRYLCDGVLHEMVICRNYGLMPVATKLVLLYGADYADIFEVRGTHRARHGELLAPIVRDGEVALGYRGLDKRVRRTRIRIAPLPTRLTGEEASFDLMLEPGAEVRYELSCACEIDDKPRASVRFTTGLQHTTQALEARRHASCEVDTSNEQFNEWITRSAADLAMMTTDTALGPYPYAGVPWFSTPFGRDAIITALSCLWMNPALARGVLNFLAETQATTVDEAADAEPGKILHEMRGGEMAALGEVPFGRYYGSIDATPLFIMLAAEYFERTNDLAFLEKLWPHIERALGWIDTCGDRDGDGFVEYLRQSPTGLVHQGWKDSHDAVFHANGESAEGPIALCEVQGYVYAARQGAAIMARALGDRDTATRLDTEARALRARFDEAFWCPSIGTYALALDGAKRPCVVRSSNAGHALLTGIAEPSRVETLAQTLLDEHSFSGWGIRTIAAGEKRYNPMAYHNGSIWPHDNALIASGLARYRLPRETVMVMAGLFDASLFIHLRRLPELFCGFPRRVGESPTLYPVACSPQAWASASVFLLLQSVLGLEIDAANRRLELHHPRLPEFLDQVRLRGLVVGEASVDLQFQRHGESVAITVLRRTGRVDIVTLK